MLWLRSTRGCRNLDAELLFQLARAGVGDAHRARAGKPLDPCILEQPRGQAAADRSREMVGLLGPVDAVAQRKPVATRPGKLNAEFGQPLVPGGRQAVVDVVAGARQAIGARILGMVAAVAAR